MNPIQQRPDSGDNDNSDALQIRIALFGFLALMMTVILIIPIGDDLALFLGMSEVLVSSTLWAITIGLYATTGLLARHYDKHYRTERRQFHIPLPHRKGRTDSVKPLDKLGTTGQG